MPVPKLSIVPLLALVLLPIVRGDADPAPIPASAYLRSVMGLTSGDLADLAAGRPVARLMRARDPEDVNVFGAVRLDMAADALVRQIREIDRIERRMGILQAGRFHEPPQLADLGALRLPDEDLDALARCRPADCDLQLSLQEIKRVQQADWTNGDRSATGDRLFKQIVFDRLQTYRAGGHNLLAPYNDRDRPISIAGEFRLLSAPGDLPMDLPAFAYYLRSYPRALLPGASDIFYWNHGDFGVKPTIRLNHVVIYPIDRPGPDAVRYVVATSQVYADHYFSATLELRTVIDDPRQPGRRLYLLYTTKSRVPGLAGFRGLLIRSLVRSRARAGMERYLGALKGVAEDAHRSASSKSAM